MVAFLLPTDVVSRVALIHTRSSFVWGIPTSSSRDAVSLRMSFALGDIILSRRFPYLSPRGEFLHVLQIGRYFSAFYLFYPAALFFPGSQARRV